MIYEIGHFHILLYEEIIFPLPKGKMIENKESTNLMRMFIYAYMNHENYNSVNYI